MSGRGSNKRKLDHEILVRMDAKTFGRVTGLAADAGIKNAEYLRRRIEMPDDDETGSSSRRGLSADDREVLGICLRNMGYVAGIMKRAVFELPPAERYDEIVRILNEHHDELQQLQGELRELLERHK